MPEIHEQLDDCILMIDRLSKMLRKSRSAQVRTSDERALAKATAYAWFNSVRPSLTPLDGNALLPQIDGGFQSLLDFSARGTTRARYRAVLKELRKSVVELRSQAALLGGRGEIPGDMPTSPPDMSPLIPDAKMRDILVRRWRETENCIEGSAPLAAVVMMGALLEAMLLARLNAVADKRLVFGLECTPMDKGTGKARPLTEWTLKHYIDVAHEMGWMRQAVRDVGIVLRDYRNYIHPEKEHSHGVQITTGDAKVLWAVFRSLAEQIVNSVP